MSICRTGNLEYFLIMVFNLLLLFDRWGERNGTGYWMVGPVDDLSDKVFLEDNILDIDTMISSYRPTNQFEKIMRGFCLKKIYPGKVYKYLIGGPSVRKTGTRSCSLDLQKLKILMNPNSQWEGLLDVAYDFWTYRHIFYVEIAI